MPIARAHSKRRREASTPTSWSVTSRATTSANSVKARRSLAPPSRPASGVSIGRWNEDAGCEATATLDGNLKDSEAFQVP
jgi:hypothetical protein